MRRRLHPFKWACVLAYWFEENLRKTSESIRIFSGLWLGGRILTSKGVFQGWSFSKRRSLTSFRRPVCTDSGQALVNWHVLFQYHWRGCCLPQQLPPAPPTSSHCVWDFMLICSLSGLPLQPRPLLLGFFTGSLQWGERVLTHLTIQPVPTQIGNSFDSPCVEPSRRRWMECHNSF